jgi:hypothetical protein
MEQKVGIIQKVARLIKKAPAKNTPVTKPQSKPPVKAGKKASKKTTKKTMKTSRR